MLLYKLPWLQKRYFQRVIQDSEIVIVSLKVCFVLPLLICDGKRCLVT